MTTQDILTHLRVEQVGKDGESLGCSIMVLDPTTARWTADALERAGYVVVPRAALEHIGDWHNKRPCGTGMESYDEIVFAALNGGSTPNPADAIAQNAQSGGSS